MDAQGVAHIVGSDMTVSDKIRALDAAGYPRADIARALGKRYQHVRNVLEADKLSPRAAPASKSSSAPAEGLEESSSAFGSVHRLKVEAGGVVRLPPEVLAALQARPGSVVIAELQADGLKLFSNSAAWDRVRAMVRELGIDPSRDLVAELIAERRAEAARDD
jgi:antitoxin component of MazEF toxin-antitoxin module